MVKDVTYPFAYNKNSSERILRIGFWVTFVP